MRVLIASQNPTTPDRPLVIAERETPEPGPHEVTIDVAACGVNRADLLQRQGTYPPPPGAPAWPGLECSGVIRAVGSDVPRWRPGDRVAALLDGGGYAQVARTRAEYLLAVPEDMPLDEAAALPEALCTVWSNLFSARFGTACQPGELVLIRGGSGGVGSIAVQLAVANGLRVAATAGGPLRLDRCRELGAEILIDHRDLPRADRDAPGPDVALDETLRAASGGQRADVILDNLGAGGLPSALAALADDGRLVIIGLQQGAQATLDLGTLLAKRARIIATALRSRPIDQKAAIVAGVAAEAWPLVVSGMVRPIIDRVLPLDDGMEAHRLLAAGEIFGKVLLAP